MSVNLNGDMSQWTFGTSFAACASGQMTADGWRYHKSNSAAVTIRRSSNVPSWGDARRVIPYSLEVEVTTADATIGSTEIAAVTYRGEGSEYADICGRQMGLEFWLCGPAGNYNLHVSNGPETLSWSEPLTLSFSNVWTPFNWRIPEPPGVVGAVGTDWYIDNRVGYTVAFTLASGSSLQDLARSWVSGLKFGNSQSNFLATVGNKLNVAGLRVGPLGAHNAGGYQIPEGVEQACTRYLEGSFDRGQAPASNIGFGHGEAIIPAQKAGAVQQVGLLTRFSAPKRKAPTMSSYNPGGAGVQARAATAGDCTATGFAGVTPYGFRFYATTPAGAVVGEEIGLNWLADATLPALTTNIGG